MLSKLVGPAASFQGPMFLVSVGPVAALMEAESSWFHSTHAQLVQSLFRL